MSPENHETPDNNLPTKSEDLSPSIKKGRQPRVPVQYFIPPAKVPRTKGFVSRWHNTADDVERFTEIGLAYFDNCHEHHIPLTANGLANALGMSFVSLWRFENHDLHSDFYGPIIRQFKQLIMEFAETNLYSKSYQGAQFQLSRLQKDVFGDEAPQINQLTISLADAINQAAIKMQPVHVDIVVQEDTTPDPLAEAMSKSLPKDPG